MMNKFPNQKPSAFRGTRTEVRDGNLGGALRKLKKTMQNEGVFREMRARRHYEKPSEIRKRAKAAARKRHLKQLAQELDDDK